MQLLLTAKGVNNIEVIMDTYNDMHTIYRKCLLQGLLQLIEVCRYQSGVLWNRVNYFSKERAYQWTAI